MYPVREPATVRGGMRRVKYDVNQHDFRAEVVRHLIDGGFCRKPVPLEDLHLYVIAEHQAYLRGPLNTVAVSFMIPPKRLLDIYFGFLKELSHDVLGYDFLFEKGAGYAGLLPLLRAGQLLAPPDALPREQHVAVRDLRVEHQDPRTVLRVL